MLRNKDIKNVFELKNGFTHRWLEPDFILSSLKCFSFSNLSKILNPFKLRGYSFESVFSILICLPFIGLKTVNKLVKSSYSIHIEAQKDVFYRLKNNSKICWRMIQWLFATKFRKVTDKKGKADTNSIRCLIFDDTIIKKTGKLIERVSMVWDHTVKRGILGFKLLVMGYWDGKSFLPLDFSLHREKGKNKEKPFGLKKRILRKQFRKKRDKDHASYQRVNETDDTKIESAIRLFWRAITQKFRVDYVLMDSWFTCEAFIKAVLKVRKQKVHLIGMYKIAKTKFDYYGKKYTSYQIRNILGKPKRCKKLNLYYNEALVKYNGMNVKLFFSKKGKNGKWRVFITTDLDISFLRMIEIYQIRWSIEVFFKESKQLLGLGSCQSNDFDAQIADITITMVQHMLLTLKYRFENYESIGKLFENTCESVFHYRLSERLWGLFIELMRIIETLFDGVDEIELTKIVLADEKAYNMIKCLFNQNNNFNEAA